MPANEQYLREHQAQEDAAEQRKERIKVRVEDMLANDPEFNPWSFRHFQEAMENMTDYTMACISTGCAAAIVDGKYTNEISNRMALTFIKVGVEEYWRNLAKAKLKE